MSLRDLLKGTGVALVTPFNDDGSIDYNGLRNVIDHVIENGVQYVVSLGTTGETPTLTRDEKIEILNFTFSTVSARVPVVIGVGGNNTAALVKDLETFPIEKSIAVLSASPYYSKPSPEGVFQHYKALAEASVKPIILYNIPGRTGSNITAAMTVRMAKEIENIAGIKEASGNMNQCMQILRDKPEEFLVVSGDDNLALSQIACGMDGVISVVANCFPKDFSTMVNYALENEFNKARAYNEKLAVAYELLFIENNPAGIKAFLSELGIIKNILRLPLVPLSSTYQKQVQEYITSIR